MATILSAEPVRQMTAYAASPSSPEDLSPTTPDVDSIPLPCAGKINWTTLQVEPQDEYASAPEFVDISKISYHSQSPVGSFDPTVSPTAARDYRCASQLRFGAMGLNSGVNQQGNGTLRNEAGRSVYSFEEMLCRAPQWPPVGSRGWSKDPAAARLGRRAHSFAGPSDRPDELS